MTEYRGDDAPLIGVTGRNVPAPRIYPGDTGLMSDLLVDTYFRAYAEKIVLAGGVPIFLPGNIDVEAVIDVLDGVVLSGGADIDPRVYGRAVSDAVGTFDTAQDEFDVALTCRSIEVGLPILGCCRGSQVINVALGGTLVEDLPSIGLAGHNIREYPPGARRHAVHFVDGSDLHGIYGASVEVNSFHHQSVADLGEGLVVSGRAEDGTVEGIEHIALPIVGVQWHPELHNGLDPVIDWIVQSARSAKVRPSETFLTDRN